MARRGKTDDPLFLVSFIKLVEKHACLWNYKLKDYSKSDVTGLAWKAIAAELKDTEQNCRDRWRNIRCAFVRAQKPPRNGSSSKLRKSYYLAEHLSFLLPYTKGNSSGNLHKTTDEPVEDHSDDPPEEERDMNEDFNPYENLEVVVAANSSTEEDSHREDSILPFVHKKRPTKRKIFSHQETSADAAFLEWVQFKKQKTQEEDADWLFLRSLLPDVKKLDDKRRRNFKGRVLSYLDELLDESEQCRTLVPTYSTTSARNFTWEPIPVTDQNVATSSADVNRID